MSAYLVEEHHIAYLAKYYKEHSHLGKHCDSRSAEEVARILARQNLDSMSARYGDPGCDNPAQYVKNASKVTRTEWLSFEPKQVIQSAFCYEYQASETLDYEKCAAREILCRIINDAAHTVTRDDSSLVWGAPEPYATNVIKLSALAARS